MRTLAIGDIHGCLHAFETLLDLVAPTQSDTLILLGDYIDRGPDSRRVVERILALRDQMPLVTLEGNHEQMILQAHAGGDEAMRAWLSNGGGATLQSYSPLGDVGKLSDIPEEHWAFFSSCVDGYETATHFFVHANVLPDIPLQEQPAFVLRWEKMKDSRPHLSGKIMICGHTSQKTGVPRNIGHAVCIDTWVYGDGWLTCLDTDSGQFWQASQAGQTRRASLEEYRPGRQ